MRDGIRAVKFFGWSFGRVKFEEEWVLRQKGNDAVETNLWSCNFTPRELISVAWRSVVTLEELWDQDGSWQPLMAYSRNVKLVCYLCQI